MTDISSSYPVVLDGQIATAARRFGRHAWILAKQVTTFLVRAETVIASCMEMAQVKAFSHTLEPSSTSHQRELTLRFQQIILPHMDAAYNFARFLSRDSDAAQDILQDAFLRAYRSFETYRGGDPRGWIFAIVRNCYLAWYQHGRRKAHFETPLDDQAVGSGGTVAHEVASQDDTAEAMMMRKSETSQVRHVINMLPDAMREILVLRELEELSYRQIAEIIDVPIGTVMSRIARARREFGDIWAALEDDGVAG